MTEPDPFEQVSDEDMLALYSGIQGQLPGGKPKDRLSFLSSMSNMLGFNPVALAGVENPDPKMADPFVDPGNATADVYGSNPLYASVFDAIDAGADPVSAVKAAKDSGQFGAMWTDADQQQNLQIATDYAKEKVKGNQAYQEWEAKTGAKAQGYTAPDGSKYKQSPMGGNDINGFASEYELLGAPSEADLVSQYAAANKVQPKLSKDEKASAIKAQSGASGMRGGPSYNLGDNMGWHYTNPADQKAAESKSRAAQAPRAGAGTGLFYDDGVGTSGVDRSVLDAQASKAAKGSVARRVDQSKNTMVRSDANRNAMARVAALLTMIQGTSK